MSEKMLVEIPGRDSIELVSYYEEFAWYYPRCEMDTKRWCVDNVQPDWCILDIGANVGYYAILFSQLAPKGEIYAFEPTLTEAMLHANLQHHGATNVEVLKLAVGNKAGVVNDAIFRVWGNDAETQDYPFVTVDGFVAERALERVDCLKIDVDSFDFEVLQGATETLNRYDPYVLVELNHALSRRQQTNAEAMSWLARQGYSEALVLDFDNFILKKSTSVQPERDSHSLKLHFLGSA